MKNASALDRAAKADEKVKQLEEDKVDLENDLESLED